MIVLGFQGENVALSVLTEHGTPRFEKNGVNSFLLSQEFIDQTLCEE